MLSPVLCFLALSPLAPQMMVLKASNTVGDPRGFEITSDGALGFAIEGATIAILDMGQFDPAPSVVIDRVNLEYPDPMSLQPYFPNGPTAAGTLFIAGGSSGLWQMDLCANLVQQHQACTGGYNVLPVFAGLPDPGRKVCIDLALLPATAQHPTPALVAVYAAIGDTLKGGPSELRIFDLTPSPSFRAKVDLPKKHPTYSTSDDAIAYAVTGISSAQRYAYVACGTAGLARVDVDQPGLGYVSGPRYRNLVGTTWYPQRVRDVASVVASDGTGVLFATLDYGGFVEVRGNDLLGSWGVGVGSFYPLATTTCAQLGNGPAPTHRVSASIVSSDKILIALGADKAGVTVVDHGAPYNSNGSWDYDLGVGFPDPGAPSNLAGCPTTFLFTQSGPLAAPVQQAEFPHEGGAWWSSLGTQRIPGVSGGFYCYEGNYDGLQRRRIDQAFTNFTTTPPTHAFNEPGVASLDGAVSSINPGVTFFGQEPFGAAQNAGQLYLDSSVPTNWALKPIPNSLDWCTPPGLGQICTAGGPVTLGGLGIYAPGLFGAESWVDAVDPTREWFFSGTNAMLLQGPDCAHQGTCGFVDPCPIGQNVYWSRNSGTAPGARGGWRLTSIRPCSPAGCSVIPDAANWDTRWWQLPSVYNAGLQQGKPQDYRAGFVDPRPGYGRPPLLHATRGATPYGYVIYKMSDIESELQPGDCAEGGNGDWLASTGTELWTHYEFDTSCDFPNLGSCSTTIIRNLAAYRCSVYSTTYASREKWISALTVGKVESPPCMGMCHPTNCPCGACPELPTCPHNTNWGAHYKEPMIVLYDVTDPNLVAPPPTLRRIGIVPGVAGRTWSIATKSVGNSAYAYVMDLAAKLYVFDVSGSKLYGALPNPSAPVTDPSNALTPVFTLPFPVNPYDGLNDSGVDVAIEGNFLYVALGRGGVMVVDISTPQTPALYGRLETPGLAEGVTIHPVNGSPALFVGDSRAGMRVYQ